MILFDAGVYIASSTYLPYRRVLIDAARRGELLLSSVVAMELLAGFRTQRWRQAFRKLRQDLERIGNVVQPEHEDYLTAGEILFALSRKHGRLDFRDHFRDGLIALEAVRSRATLLTENSKHFLLWRQALMRAGRSLRLQILTRP